MALQHAGVQMTKSLMPGLVYASGVIVGTEKYSQVTGKGAKHHTVPVSQMCLEDIWKAP